LRVENLCFLYVRAGDALTKADDFADFLPIRTDTDAQQTTHHHSSKAYVSVLMGIHIL
jgi:hypothetical protein